MNINEYFSDNFEKPDEFTEHLNKKRKRSKNLKRQRAKIARRLAQLSTSGNCKPSVWVDWYYDNDTGNYSGTKRIYYGKKARTQKTLKRAANKKVRRAKELTFPVKGNDYKRMFDYMWIWL